MTHDETDRFSALTEQTAEAGCILSPQGVLLAVAERWFEDGLHVIRSTELDLIAEDPNPKAVVDVFVDNLLDYLGGLAELGDEVTEHEKQIGAIFAPRLFEAARQSEIANRRPRVQVRLRQREQRTGHWRRQTRRASSKTPSLA